MMLNRPAAGRPTLAATRSGMSLMEVVVSLAIFGISLAAIGFLLNLTTNLARDTQDVLYASHRCRSKMNEVIAGVVPLTNAADTSFEDDDAWYWSLDCEQDSSVTNLWRVTITVSKQSGGVNKVMDSLTQYVLDPSARGTLDTGTAPSSGGGSMPPSGGAAGAGGATP